VEQKLLTNLTDNVSTIGEKGGKDEKA